MWLCYVFFFFFQAEDGIRDVAVTGVQTCALPICNGPALGIREWLREEAIQRVVIFMNETEIDSVPLIEHVIDLQGIVVEVVGSSPFPRIARGVQTITEPEIVGERHRG